MTVDQLLASYAVVAILVVIGLLLSVKRGGTVLAIVSVVLMLAAGAFFRPVGTSVFPIVAIAVATGIVYARRNSRTLGARLLTGAVTWLGLIFALFGTAYVLRS